jgi:hypothetical protein
VRLTGEKEKLIHQLHGGGKPVAAIARLVGLTRKSKRRRPLGITRGLRVEE